MNNIDELYFAVKTCDLYVNKGSFNYKKGDVKKDGDVSCSYNKIKFIDDMIQISYCEDVTSDVEVSGSYCVSYSSKTNETVVGTYSFEELKNSEHWEDITKRYQLKEKAYERYKENYVSETKDGVEVYYSWGGLYLDIQLNKITGDIHICGSVNDIDFYGIIYDLRIIDNKEYEALQRKAKILDLMENHKVQLLENGCVVDNVYYESIDDYEEEG